VGRTAATLQMPENLLQVRRPVVVTPTVSYFQTALLQLGLLLLTTLWKAWFGPVEVHMAVAKLEQRQLCLRLGRSCKRFPLRQRPKMCWVRL
jgi:hypothetical protein